MPVTLRRWGARMLDALAVAVIAFAIIRFVIVPRLHAAPSIAPPVSLATLSGGRFDLAAHRGHVVFLDFFATWCTPCRDSIPLVQHFRRSHPGVDVVSIDVGENLALVRPFARSFGLRDVAVDPDQTVAHAFAVDGFPTIVAIDASGRIGARWIGFIPDIEHDLDGAAARYGARTAALPSAAGERRLALTEKGR